MVKALVLFSGGLDSRLVVKILQEQGIEVEAVLFQLPFGSGCCNDFSCSFKFTQMEGVKLKIIDCTKGKLFQEYLKIIKKPKHGTGSAINPCRDCRIFLFKQAKKLAKEMNADFIATGEVLGERPMSQHKPALLLIEKEAGLTGKIVRPLSAKLLPKTDAEKKGLVDREKLFGIEGRYRKKQIELAEKYKIRYPAPAGGCLLCEKDYAKKLTDLFKYKKRISPEDIFILNIGRHFRKNGKIILGRNKKENEEIESIVKAINFPKKISAFPNKSRRNKRGNSSVLDYINKKLKYNIIIPDLIPGPTAIFENKKDKELAEKMINAYSSKDLKLREKFEKYKI